ARGARGGPPPRLGPVLGYRRRTAVERRGRAGVRRGGADRPRRSKLPAVLRSGLALLPPPPGRRDPRRAARLHAPPPGGPRWDRGSLAVPGDCVVAALL